MQTHAILFLAVTMTNAGLASGALPSFEVQPRSHVLAEGTHITLFAYAGGSDLVSIQWYRDNQPANSPWGGYYFHLDETTAADAGNYYLVMCYTSGCITSQVARLTVVPAGSLDDWEKVRPTGITAPLGPVACGNGRFVAAAGDAGDAEILVSEDGVHWRDSGADFGLYYDDLLFANGKFYLAGGEDHGPATILSSSNGIDWVEVFVEPHWGIFSQLHWSNGRFLTIAYGEGSAPQLFTSTDGVHWTSHDPGLPRSLHMLAVHDGKWLGVWFDAGGKAVTAASSDGLSWTNVGAVNLDYLLGIVAGADVYVAHGVLGLAWSRDGVTWSNVVVDPPIRSDWFRSLTYTSNGFIGAVAGFCEPGFCSSQDIGLVTSRDGINWQARRFPVSTDIGTIMVCDGFYVATGDQGVIFTSADSTNWIQRAGSSTRQIRSLAGHQSAIVAIGDRGLILSSADGTDWSHRDGITRENLHAVVFHQAQFIAVGGDIHSLVASSLDGSSWNTLSNASTGPLQAALASGDEVLAVGLRGAIGRFNGTWTFSSASDRWDFRALARLAQQFVAIARRDAIYPFEEQSIILTSPDGQTWTPRYTNATGLFAIAAGGGKAVAVGQGLALVSSDGMSWVETDLSVRDPFNAVTFAAGTFLVSGYGGALFSSRNGVDWIVHDLGPQPHNFPQPTVSWIGLAAERLFVGADHETIWRSLPVAPSLNQHVQRQTGELLIEIHGMSGQRFRLQSSSDLISWANIGLHTNNPPTVLRIPIDRGEPRRFYRVVAP